MRQERISLIAVVAAHFGYYFWPVGVARSWVYYIAIGLLLVWLGWCLLQSALTFAGGMAGAYLMIEAGQQAACGALAFGMLPTGRDICRDVIGEDFYRAVGSLALAGMVALWLSRQQQK